MKKNAFIMGLILDLVISVAFIAVTSLLLAGIHSTGLSVAMVVLAIVMFLVTLALIIAYFAPGRRRSGDPE